MHWFKIHHGFATDPKFGLIAHQVSIPRAVVLAIALDLIDHASRQPSRGCVKEYDEEAASYSLGVDVAALRNVTAALRNKRFIADDSIVNWGRYQGVADPTNAARQARFRDKKKQGVSEEVTAVTDSNALRNIEEKRGEKREKGAIAPKASRFALDALPPEWKLFCQKERPDLTPENVFAAFSDFWTAKPGSGGLKLDWLATWRNWVRSERGKAAAGQPKAQKSNIHTL